ncbi:MAG TPA: maleylpyruvate isomerase family mycothiol-dependent enzyme [Acidimicrobiales bacterium]|nr:maleylpyruvate isomerase family mycothiol-dependent enzyme [Acidimicrobiales bacterium]
MHRDRYLEQLARDGRRMADLARGDLDAPVPTCPSWTLRDLIEHTGYVHRWQTEACRVDHGDFPDPALHRIAPTDGQSWADWFQAGVDRAVAVMSQVAPDEPRWTWSAPGGGETAQWYFRRITLETLVHRIDAELATDDVTDVDPELTADGIAEMCEVFIPAAAGQPIGGSGQTLHLHATDADAEWLLTLHADRVDVARGHAKGDAAVRGTARDLLLLVWGREPLGPVEVFGDESVVATFRAAAKI